MASSWVRVRCDAWVFVHTAGVCHGEKGISEGELTDTRKGGQDGEAG